MKMEAIVEELIKKIAVLSKEEYRYIHISVSICLPVR